LKSDWLPNGQVRRTLDRVWPVLESLRRNQETVLPARLNPPIESASQGSDGADVAVGGSVGLGSAVAVAVMVLVGDGGSSVSVAGGMGVLDIVGEANGREVGELPAAGSVGGGKLLESEVGFGEVGITAPGVPAPSVEVGEPVGSNTPPPPNTVGVLPVS
jgi:hypothetical protein